MAEQVRDCGDTAPSATGRRIISRKVPIGIRFLEKTGLCICCQGKSHKVLVYFLTFFTYTVYYIARKPFSIVKVALCPECADSESNYSNSSLDSSPQGWPPFEGDYARTLLGSLDYSWLFAYAIALYFSGWIGDRVNLRYLLSFGLIGSGIATGLLGVAYFANIHHLAYFIVLQILGGIMQSTGWPSLVAVVADWFGKQRRGLLLGLWTMNAPLGSILGIVIPSFWADAESPWGWSFIVPAFITIGYGIVIFLFLTIDPQHVGLPPPVHHLSKIKKDVLKSGGVTNPLTEATDNGGEVIMRNLTEPDCRVSLEVTTETNNAMMVAGKESTEEQHSNQEDPQEPQVKSKAVGFCRALLIPGVIEYSLALFFDKMVVFTFFFWLPFYVKFSHSELSERESAWISILYDVGAIIGAVGSGVISDLIHSRALTVVGMLILAVPSLYLLNALGSLHLAFYGVLLILCGMFINGPLFLITATVSSDLGTHKSLKDNHKAKATVAAIINGTGSLGGAFGPLLIGLITDTFGWTSAFYVLMIACFVAALVVRMALSDHSEPRQEQQVGSSRIASWMIKGLLQLSFDNKRRNWYKYWMGGESWHAINKLFNPPFLILKLLMRLVIQDSKHWLRWYRGRSTCKMEDEEEPNAAKLLEFYFKETAV